MEGSDGGAFDWAGGGYLVGGDTNRVEGGGLVCGVVNPCSRKVSEGVGVCWMIAGGYALVVGCGGGDRREEDVLDVLNGECGGYGSAGIVDVDLWRAECGGGQVVDACGEGATAGVPDVVVCCGMVEPLDGEVVRDEVGEVVGEEVVAYVKLTSPGVNGSALIGKVCHVGNEGAVLDVGCTAVTVEVEGTSHVG